LYAYFASQQATLASDAAMRQTKHFHEFNLFIINRAERIPLRDTLNKFRLSDRKPGRPEPR
jgi:hypothetical protein